MPSSPKHSLKFTFLRREKNRLKRIEALGLTESSCGLSFPCPLAPVSRGSEPTGLGGTSELLWQLCTEGEGPRPGTGLW